MLSTPLVLDATGAVPVPPPAAGSVGRAAGAAGELLEALTERTVPVGSLSEGLLELSRAARTAAAGATQTGVPADESARVTRDNAAGLREELIPARIRYDEFFRVRRVAGLSPHELRLGVLDTVARTCEDAALAPLGLVELTELVRGMHAMLTAVDQGHGGVAAASRSEAGGHESDDERALRRWVTGHHLVAICSEFGRRHLVHAERGLESPSEHATVAADIARAEVCVRAVGAAMSYAATMPRSIYLRHIRPLMDAASGSAHGFSGVDNYDYLQLRETWERVHRALTDGEGAALCDARVAPAAVSLFAAILEENERHTLIAAAMVGTAPSLKQVHEVTPIAGWHATPAVEALRQNTDQRREMLEALTARVAAARAEGALEERGAPRVAAP